MADLKEGLLENVPQTFLQTQFESAFLSETISNVVISVFFFFSKLVDVGHNRTIILFIG